jgi:hypothetical protein
MELGTVAVQGEAANKPALRLSDRFIGPLWEDTASGTRTITLDQGSSPLSIDSVLGAAGHNLAGLTLTAEHDADPGFGSPTTLGTVVPSGTAAWRITGTASAERYWRLTIASAASPPTLGELFFSLAVAFPYGPSDTDLVRGRMANVVKHETEAGIVIAFKRGATRWSASFTIADISDATQRPRSRPCSMTWTGGPNRSSTWTKMACSGGWSGSTRR